jgi:hypothetical protein
LHGSSADLADGVDEQQRPKTAIVTATIADRFDFSPLLLVVGERVSVQGPGAKATTAIQPVAAWREAGS